MRRSSLFLATALLAGTCLSGSAQAGLFNWDSSSKKPEQTVNASQAAAPVGNLDDDIRQAQSQRASGDLDGATRALAQMMMVYPDDPRVVGEYGKVLVQKGRSRDAVDFLRRATDLQPNDWTLYSALGVAYDQLNDPNSATSAYNHALQLKPGEAVVLNNFALSRVLVGDLDGAQRMLAQASATPNANPKIASNVMMVASLKGAPAAGAPATAVAVAANHPLAKPVETASLAPVQAKPMPANVIMQKVPFDPKAGPVAVAKAAPAATHAPRKLAAASASPVKVAAKKKDATPSLRMTADASAP
jgi:Flp pilus assembly protein TadD